MNFTKMAATLALSISTLFSAEMPENLVADGIPPIPREIKADIVRYVDFRAAVFQSWHPTRREMLITTRFGDTAQIHHLQFPGGARKQLTFFAEPVSGVSFHPVHGRFALFSQDVGGGEFYQLYRFDLEDGKPTLLTDGKSRNSGGRWSKNGDLIAYTSTRRTGKDNDIWIMNPAKPETDRLAIEVSGGGWGVADWSEDGTQLLVSEYISINESYLHLAEAKSGNKKLITPKGGEKASYSGARFSKDGKSVFTTTDKNSEFKRLARINLSNGEHTFLTEHIKWDVEDFELSHDGKTIAFVANEDGIGALHLLNVADGSEKKVQGIPFGVIGGLEWHRNNQDIGFTLSSARSPSDAYSLHVKSGKIERWTESEMGGLDAKTFVEPELIKFKSFDGTEISAFCYRADAKKFPGKRPVLVIIHGGPESQTRPSFQARNNYYINELGMTLIAPNVRGSSGYGKSFLQMDNGFKREDSVKDIGALLDWVAKQPGLDAGRVVVMGGSYGGYMVLASMIHFGDRLLGGVDIVGISNFLTFLKNTQDYRRDLRRVEYGDERDPAMHEFLGKISPSNQADKLKKPLLIVQGLNDPRVPATESEQMVKAVRDHGGKVWYLLAKDEGHGFAKKKNQDYQFMVTALFLKSIMK
ncbi:MAG: S9 family peptidase [Verrucomicrobiales bacterium]